MRDSDSLRSLPAKACEVTSKVFASRATRETTECLGALFTPKIGTLVDVVGGREQRAVNANRDHQLASEVSKAAWARRATNALAPSVGARAHASTALMLVV